MLNSDGRSLGNLNWGCPFRSFLYPPLFTSLTYPSLFFFTMGNTQSVPPKNTPLGCLLKNFKALGLTNLKPKCLILYCNMACLNINWVTRRFGPQTDLLTIIVSSSLAFTVTISIPYLSLVLERRRQHFNFSRNSRPLSPNYASSFKFASLISFSPSFLYHEMCL